MDLKPARSQDLWWCECVGVHLLQTHRSVWGREAGAFKSELSQSTRKKKEENREDGKTIRSLTMKHCKGSAVVNVEIQILPRGRFYTVNLFPHELWENTEFTGSHLNRKYCTKLWLVHLV